MRLRKGKDVPRNPSIRYGRCRGEGDLGRRQGFGRASCLRVACNCLGTPPLGAGQLLNSLCKT